MEIYGMTVEYTEEPVAVDTFVPRFGWKLRSSERGQAQAAYSVTVKEASGDICWDSGKKRSSQSVDILYAGSRLKACTRYLWCVTVWDSSGRKWRGSQQCFWTGKLGTEWDGAKWIGNKDDDISVPYLRKTFLIKKEILSARLYISGIGINYAYINGKKVGDAVLDPANTNYEKTILYSVFDVTELVAYGKNAVAVELGRGFYDIYEETPWNWNRASWKDNPKLLLELKVDLVDGISVNIVSDTSWKIWSDGPVTYNSIYFGEHYDARKEQTMLGWTESSFDDSGWTNADELKAPRGILTAQLMPPMRVVRQHVPVSVEKRDGMWFFDFGRQIAGWVSFTVRGLAGTELIFISAEKRTNGTIGLCTWALNDTDGYPCIGRYITKGAEAETFTPKYNYKGFRYIGILGLPAGTVPNINDLIAEEVRSDVKVIGAFNCSNALFNQIHANVVRTIGNNLHGKPTDTPTYEKNGWTGDANVSLDCIFLNYDAQIFMEKYYNDITDSMCADGSVSQIAPTDTWGYSHENVWDSIVVNLPMAIFDYFGSANFVREKYKYISRYIRGEINLLQQGNYLTVSQMGDWMAPGEDKRGAKPPEGPEIAGNAYGYKAMKAASRLATIARKQTDADEYGRTACRMRQAINDAFFKGDEYRSSISEYELQGEMIPVGYRQTSNVLPLAFGIAKTKKDRDAVAAKLIAELENDPRLDTGIAGTRWLFPVLCELGRSDLAYRVATNTDYPGYGYLVKNGADSMFESWEFSARSYQHYFLGTIDAWFYQYVAGIYSFSNGFASLTIKPFIMGDLTYACAAVESVRGKVAVAWVRNGDRLEMEVTVPVGTAAQIYVPAKNEAAVSESSQMRGVRFVEYKGGYCILETGSGTYRFTSAL